MQYFSAALHNRLFTTLLKKSHMGVLLISTKNKTDSKRMFDDGKWRLLEGEYNGGPISVRINAHLDSFAGKSDHTLKIGFAIPLNHPNPGQMPHPDENDAIGDIEDRIIEELSSKSSAVQALAITMGTFKEFVFYAKPDTDVALIHKSLMASIKTHKIQCIAKIENDWETYKKWAIDQQNR